MKSARIIVLAIAVGAGGLAALLAGNLSEPEVVEVQQAAAPPPAIATDEVLVASRDIPMGTAVTAEGLSWQAWPKDALNPSYITKETRPGALEELSSTIARAPFLAGEPIKEGKLVRSDRGFMSAILPAGMRAVATRISPETGAGGFILPNDRVDVILTRRMGSQSGPADGSSYVSETVLTNVRVLAIDQTIEEQNGEKVVVGNTATLEMLPEQAEALALADQLGELSLSLRSLADAAADGDGPQMASGVGGKKGSGTSGVTMVKYGIQAPAMKR
ncbi:MAG: Flp pilus assembly protein CpaB [Hyphomicrobiales bacterium]